MEIYTDGAATMRLVDGEYVRENGGWAFAEVKNGEVVYSLNGQKLKTTNNECELTAIMNAVLYFESSEDNDLIIYSDSAYSINCLTQWATNWEKNDWTRGKKHEPIENLEVIRFTYEKIKELEEKGFPITFVKVKGHAGNPVNEFVDKLAVAAKEGKANDNPY